MAKGLRPQWIPLPKAAIGRLPSRIPVIIRSHESSGAIVHEVLGVGINYFAKSREFVIPGPRSGTRDPCRNGARD